MPLLYLAACLIVALAIGLVVTMHLLDRATPDDRPRILGAFVAICVIAIGLQALLAFAYSR